MNNNIHPNLRAALDNMSEEQIAKILNTEYSASDIVGQMKRLEQIKEQLCNPEEVTIEGWVARDANGDVNIFDSRPHIGVGDFWMNDGCYYLMRDLQYEVSDILPSLTYENSPKKVKITITPIEE